MACVKKIFLDPPLVPSVTLWLEEEALKWTVVGKENPRHFEVSSELRALREAGGWTPLCLGALSLGSTQ